MDEFKTGLMPQLVEKTKEEPGVIEYRFGLQGNTLAHPAVFASADAFAHHMQFCGELLAQLGGVGKFTEVSITGSEEELSKAKPLAESFGA